MTLYTIGGKLSPVQPFDLKPSLDFLSAFTPAQNQQTIVDGKLTKAVLIGGQMMVFQVWASETELAYQLYSESELSEPVQRAAEDRITFYLSLDDDLRPFYAIGQADPAFAPVIEQLYGYHQVKFLTPFENAVWAILSQRIPTAVAQMVKQRITTALGAVLTVDGVTYTAFPEAQHFLEAADELPALVGNARKAEYLLSAAHAFASVDEAWLRHAPYADAEQWLLKIKGIGAWSANFILLRGLGRMDRVPLTEGRLNQAVRERYGQQPISEIAARYGEYQGYWAHYLRALS